MTGKIRKVSGPLVVAEGLSGAGMFDEVRVGPRRLIGEIIGIRGGLVSIQVCEETAGLGPGDAVEAAGAPLSAELGPGLLGTVYDGIQRPLETLRAQDGDTVGRGTEAAPLDREKKWDFVPLVKPGDRVEPGDILGSVQETAPVSHRVLVPHGVSGKVLSIEAGAFALTEAVAAVASGDGVVKALTMLQKWPVRVARPYKEQTVPCLPLLTGQDVLDARFPLARGAAAAVAGPSGSGKTTLLRQLAQCAGADILVCVGCGARGGEMTDVLRMLRASHSNEALFRRTIWIVNTADMPAPAREAAVCTGVTIAEYYRDMGYDTAVLIDTVSRWAETLSEMSGRRGETSGEAGVPSGLSARLAWLYGRAGRVYTLGQTRRVGSLTVVGAVSAPGGDLSDPVCQAAMRAASVFWALDPALARRRRFPAVDPLHSWSHYNSRLCREEADTP